MEFEKLAEPLEEREKRVEAMEVKASVLGLTSAIFTMVFVSDKLDVQGLANVYGDLKRIHDELRRVADSNPVENGKG